MEIEPLRFGAHVWLEYTVANDHCLPLADVPSNVQHLQFLPSWPADQVEPETLSKSVENTNATLMNSVRVAHR